MKVLVQQRGWSAAPMAARWLHPNGYYSYLLIPANGMICYHHEWADSNDLIPEGEYDFPDSMFDPKDEKWDKDYEEIVV